MRAMILAAGLGTRLRPITDTVPKPLVEVAGHPLIAYPLAVVREAGIREVIINLHHLGDQVRQSLGDGSAYGLSITYSEENPILDTGGAIKNAESFLGEETFVVLNGDMVIDLNLSAAIRFHRDLGALATMVLRPDASERGYGVIETDDRGRIRRFLGQPDKVDAVLEPMMFTGVHIFEPAVFSYMKAGKFGINSVTYPSMLAAGETLGGFRFEGYWGVLDTHELLEQGRREVAREGVLAPARIPRAPTS